MEDIPLKEKQQNTSETDSSQPPTKIKFDLILVSSHEKDDENQNFLNRSKSFLEELEKKNISITKIVHDGKIFYGLRAHDEIFAEYQHLLKVSDSCNPTAEINQANRIRIVHFILQQTRNSKGDNLEKLIEDDVFESLFCLHDPNDQKLLRRTWARWTALFNRQPLEDVKNYFGEKVALYYVWLETYTRQLVPASVIGVVVFLYGLAFFNTSPLIKEVCDTNITMCPRCESKCDVWYLSDTCSYAKISHLFDNEGTVAFAWFMAIWATMSLELWKRRRAKYISQWNVYDWCEDEDELIMHIVDDPDYRAHKFSHPYGRSALILTLVTIMLMFIIGIAHVLVVFRVVAAPILSGMDNEFLDDHGNTVAMMLGAVLHYVTIQVMTRVNRWVALKLCELEKRNSLAARERSFTVKMFTFQFFTLFSSLFYIAFFLGRINGHPGDYVRLAGYRLEECHPSGCLTDLFIQMAVIMVLKQTINNIVEFTGPWLKGFCNRASGKKLERKCGHCYKVTCRSDICKLRDWMKNYQLVNTDEFSLFNEILEMVIQFSFTTIFVAAFPLAPLLAFINNIFEIRLDAIKMVCLEKRLIPRKTNDLGVWNQILEVIGVLAVIANGLVIGFSSDFIPRLVYRFHYGPCMEGYINNTLSIATNVTDNIPQCSYRDYRNPDYSLTPQFWLVLAARFAFVVLFEHVVVVCKFVVAGFVPDNPINVKNDRVADKLSRLQEEYRQRKRCKSTEV